MKEDFTLIKKELSRATNSKICFTLLFVLFLSCNTPKNEKYTLISFYNVDSIINIHTDTNELSNLNNIISNGFPNYVQSFPDLNDSCRSWISDLNLTCTRGFFETDLCEYIYNSNCSNSLFTNFVYDKNNDLVFCIDSKDEAPGFDVYLKNDMNIDSFVTWLRQDTCLLFSKLFTLKAGNREVLFTP
jgi:hypothetical protein